MTATSQHDLEKQVLRIRDNLAVNLRLNESDIAGLHVAMIHAMLDSLIAGKNHTFVKLPKFKSKISSELLMDISSELIPLAESFRHTPGALASLLELKPDNSAHEETEAEKYGDRHDKKRRSGQFFTPLYIADFMAHLMVDQFLESHKGNLKDLKILDPAVGGGIFLDAVFNALKSRGYVSGEIAGVLHGIDLDPDAITLNRKVLKIKAGGCKIDKSNFLTGDFLSDKLTHPENGYDCIIANPPYISFYSRESHSDTDEVKRHYLKRYGDIAGRNVNTFIYFIARGIELLKANGLLCYIVPDKILWNRRYSKIRQHILEKASPIAIFKAGEGVFSGATVGSVIILLRKNADMSEKCRIADITLRDGKIRISDEKKVKPSDFLSDTNFKFIIRNNLAERFERDTVPLSGIVHIRDGINPAFADFRSRVISNRKETSDHLKLIEGSDISPFRITPRKLYVQYDPKLVTPELQKRGVSFREPWIFKANPKLVNRQTSSRLIFALDRNQLCDLNSVHNTILRDDYAKMIPFHAKVDSDRPDESAGLTVMYFLLGILNSKLMNFIYQSKTHEISKAFPQVHIADLKELPIRIPNQDLLEKIASIAESLSHSNSISSGSLNELDSLVFDLYDAGSKDRQHINGIFKNEWRAG
jgi:methylase of polypeptide subunit release factors